jgi:hypothetical protein
MIIWCTCYHLCAAHIYLVETVIQWARYVMFCADYNYFVCALYYVVNTFLFYAHYINLLVEYNHFRTHYNIW